MKVKSDYEHFKGTCYYYYEDFFEQDTVIKTMCRTSDGLCGLVVRVAGYRSGGPGSGL
jgi:hypothetical protein